MGASRGCPLPSLKSPKPSPTLPLMSFLILVVIGWMFVVLMMAIAEAVSPIGSVLGALVTFVLYGLAPVALVTYLLATPLRRKRQRAAEAAQAQAASGVAPDGGGQPPAVAEQRPVAPEREEP
jgi:hypothetical protein